MAGLYVKVAGVWKISPLFGGGSAPVSSVYLKVGGVWFSPGQSGTVVLPTWVKVGGTWKQEFTL